jgi:hypothetical protein
VDTAFFSDSEESDDAIGGLRRRRDRPFAEDRPQIIYEVKIFI